ncbi:MAG: ELM1/GtrOC1 family putative glycosyltransferase [Pseudomonadales bacterium]
MWILVGDKAGDNAQIDIVRERLDGPVEYRRLTFLARYQQGKPWFRASLDHVDPARSDALEPPWPDLVITIGRRPAMAALWIKQRSGGATRVVLFGRPKRWLDRFDLVVAPTQYAVPPAANVLHITLPLMRVEPDRLAAAAGAWQDRLSALPRPLIGVLVGGATFPYRLDARTAREILSAAGGYAGPHGSLYVSTSRRTPPAAADALAAHLPAGSHLYRWGTDAGDNPYPALLAHADGFVVTGDSISMLTEVARVGRPLAVFPLPRDDGLRARAAAAAARLTAAAPELAGNRLLERLGIRLFPRDLARIHEWLFSHGMAVAAGTPLPRAATGPVATDDDLEAVLARIAALRGDAR